MKVDIEIIFKNKFFPDAYQLWNIVTAEEKGLSELSIIDGYSGNNMLFGDVSQYLQTKKSDDFLVELSGGY